MNIDIIFLQESFITENEFSLLDYIDENYQSISVPATSSQRSIETITERPMGGLFCFYNKTLNNIKIELISNNNDFMIVKFTTNTQEIILVNAYIRSDLGTADSLASYL